MSKTNHKRNFKDTRDYSVTGINRYNKKGLTGSNNDFVNGKHGAAKNRKGLKKFIISRKRFNNKMNLRNEVLKTND